MALYLISYDLRQPGQNYAPLYATLGNWGAKRLLESVWLVSINATAVSLRDTLQRQVDQNDGVAVIELKSGSAWATLTVQPDGATWLKTYMP